MRAQLFDVEDVLDLVPRQRDRADLYTDIVAEDAARTQALGLGKIGDLLGIEPGEESRLRLRVVTGGLIPLLLAPGSRQAYEREEPKHHAHQQPVAGMANAHGRAPRGSTEPGRAS